MTAIRKNSEKMRRGIFHTAIFAAVLMLMLSCVTKSALLQQVTQKTSTLTKTAELYSKPHLVLIVDSVNKSSVEVVSINKKSSYLIPLIIYWGWGQKFEVKLPEQYLINLFNRVLITKDNEFEYQKYFKDKTLEIEIVKLPDRFNYSLSSTYWFLPYIAGLDLYYSYEKIYPDDQEITLKYRFYNRETNLKQGKKSLDMKFPKSEIYNPSSQNMLYYIDDFRKEFEYLAGKLIEMIVDDL